MNIKRLLFEKLAGGLNDQSNEFVPLTFWLSSKLNVSISDNKDTDTALFQQLGGQTRSPSARRSIGYNDLSN